MRIAIQAADLDSKRIDGTRVYLLNLLNIFGKISNKDDFFIFHKNNFNSELEPKNYPNYKITKIPFPFYWTQTRFAFELWREKFDALWMPMQALPFVRRKNLKTTVTIHDLAFKIFPELFTCKDLRRLNLFADFSINNSDKIIAVSNSTKKDILKFYPGIKEEKIKVIYHGFDPNLFQKEMSKEDIVLKSYKLKPNNYILYVGALQPRKNLEVLVEAFERLKNLKNLSRSGLDNFKLVLAGGKAWMWDKIINKVEKSKHKTDIIITGTVSFSDIVSLYKNASVFVFPSLYEGFGIPILEAFASKIPAILASNSSFQEVGGEAALYFNEKSPEDLVGKIKTVLENYGLRNDLVKKGEIQLQKFSWEKCARETLNFIRS